jgi:hypothetical protein
MQLMPTILMPRVTRAKCHNLVHYSECRCAECRSAECRSAAYLNDIIILSPLGIANLSRYKHWS